MDLFKALKNIFSGHSGILLLVLGWIFVITGLVFLARPEQARAKLVKQGGRAMKWGLRLVLLYIAMTAFTITGKLSGLLPVILNITVIIGAVLIYFKIGRKSLEILTERFAHISVSALRIYAACLTIAGALMVWLPK